MSHVDHIAKNKELLELRFEITRVIREFFWQEGFLEVETPLILRLPGQEPYLNPMKVSVHDERGTEYHGYLHTSPEYAMKKMLAAGFTKIFSICKTFRDHESFGGTHNPEFTLIEWYRSKADFWELMQDIESLFQYLQKWVMSNEKRVIALGLQNNSFLISRFSFRRVHMRDLWREYVGVNLDEYLDLTSMARLVADHYSLPITHYQSYEDAFYKIFLNEIEPKLTAPTIIHHYPAAMAALSKLSETDPGYAERFEVYVNGMELANAFTELTDAEEQFDRLKKEKRNRENMGKDVFDIDTEFIEAVRRMPPSAGIALGVDRLAQVLLGVENINDILALPMAELWGDGH